MTGVRAWLRAAWDRLLGFTAITLGGALVVAGYLGVSGSRRIPTQASYLASGSAAGLCLLICGATLVLSADLRDQWRKLHRLGAPVIPDEVILPPEATAPRDAASRQQPGPGASPDALELIARQSGMRGGA